MLYDDLIFRFACSVQLIEDLQADLFGNLRIICQIFAGVISALPYPHIIIREPGTGFIYNIVCDGNIYQAGRL